MNKAFLLWLCLLAFYSCNNPVKSKKEGKDALPYTAMIIKEKNLTPTVDISEYKLIAAANEDRVKDAAQIIDLKRKWPLVMQSPTRMGFDTIFARNFTFSGDGPLLNREDYIIDRMKPSDWKITSVKYDHLTLQFFGNTALLTYRNQVTNVHITTGEVEVEYISWADVYLLEDRKWKIGASHTIDVRVEKKI